VVAGDGDVILHVESSNAAHCMAAKDYAAAVAWALNEAGGHNAPIVQPPIPLPEVPNRDGLRDNQTRALCSLRHTCRAVQEARVEGE
jgi:hypothetical protein